MDTTSATHDLLLRVRETAARVIAIAVLALVVGLLLSTYIGHAKGPYGVCYGRSGRSVPCEVAARSGKP
jgi:hypothetical protein